MNTSRTPSYAEVVRLKMQSRDNVMGEPMTLKQLHGLIGYSYEHIRKVVIGEPVASREFNAAVCQALRLNENEMWALARSEKMARRFGDVAAPPDSRVRELWNRISASDRERVIKIIEGMALAQDAA